MTGIRVSGDTGEIEEKSRCKPSLGELLGSFQVNDCLIKLIHQFLLYNEFENTADSLVHEAPKLGFDVLSEHLCTKNSIPKDVCRGIMSQYITGDWKHFFNLWDNLIPPNVRETAEYKILTFKLHLHFAILPLRIKRLNLKADKRLDEISKMQTAKILENAVEKFFFAKEADDNQTQQMILEAMEQFRIYLESDGLEFEEKTELLPLFALPCLNDAQTYATFPELFELSWMEDLTKTIQVFLLNHKQVRLMTSQKTSTETMTTASRPYVCVQGNVVNVPLTCENLKEFEDELFSINTDGKIPMTRNDIPNIPLEITTSSIMGFIPQQIIDNNIDIEPNDRNIPMFREDIHHPDLDDQNLGYCDKHKSHKIHSKSAQTRISTVTTTTNFISTSDLRHPATILNSSTYIKSMKDKSIKSYQELALTKSHLYNIQCNYGKLKLRFHKLHSDYHKLIGIAGELTAALENSVRGQAVDLQAMLESCIAIFPDLFNHNIRGNTSESKALHDQEVELKQIDLTETSRFEFNINPISPKLLDYRKIKLHLINGSVKTKLLLLQALRWKLTLSQPGDRDETITEYLRGDLLGLHAQVACDSGKQILPYLLMPKDVAIPHPLQQSAARLINTLASLRCGRDYLAVGSTLLNLIVKCLKGNNGESIDAFTCDMIIAMLQKMSSRKQQRLYMIETGLVEWLINHLKSESPKIGSYRLEYATALLMNLSLHEEAQIRASVMAPVVISTLTTLLDTDYLPALPYINGCLNSFLSNQTINEEAKKSALTSILEYHREQNSGEIKKHLEHILKIHNRDYTNDTEDCETVDDENEELDVLEDELEEGDPVKVHSGELSGEALLASCYSITPNDSIELENKNIVESRPKTPKMHSRTNSIRSSSRQKHQLNKHHDDAQTPTRDIGLSPRLTPQRLISRKREKSHLITVATSPVRSLIERLLPHSKQGREMTIKKTGLEYLSPFLSEIGSNSINRITSRISLISAASDSNEKIEGMSDKSEASTCSPFFFSFTRTYEPKQYTSDKSMQPTLKSTNSPNAFIKKLSIDSTESNNPEKINKRPRFIGNDKFSKIPSFSGKREKKMKSVRLNYSGESNNSQVALCLYANESSKGSSKTTVASSAVLVGETCNSVIVAETEKLSSIASLDCKIVTNTAVATPNQTDQDNPILDKEVDAFLAKPKISRTPPLSAQLRLQTVSAHNKTNTKRVSTK